MEREAATVTVTNTIFIVVSTINQGIKRSQINKCGSIESYGQVSECGRVTESLGVSILRIIGEQPSTSNRIEGLKLPIESKSSK
jgi:hypothetical protein